MKEFSPEKSMRGLDKREKREKKNSIKRERRLNRQGRNLAEHAIRKVHQGMINELIPAKYTSRFSPFRKNYKISNYDHYGELRYLEAEDDPERLERANALLREQGLELELVTQEGRSSYDPEIGMLKVKLTDAADHKEEKPVQKTPSS